MLHTGTLKAAFGKRPTSWTASSNFPPNSSSFTWAEVLYGSAVEPCWNRKGCFPLVNEGPGRLLDEACSAEFEFPHETRRSADHASFLSSFPLPDGTGSAGFEWVCRPVECARRTKSFRSAGREKLDAHSRAEDTDLGSILS